MNAIGVTLLVILYLYTLGMSWVVYRVLMHFIDIKSENRRQWIVIGELQLALTQAEGALGIRTAEAVEEMTKVFKNPDLLDAELERAGQLSDMRRARRRHLPRENAGPPAKTRKMRFSR